MATATTTRRRASSKSAPRKATKKAATAGKKAVRTTKAATRKRSSSVKSTARKSARRSTKAARGAKKTARKATRSTARKASSAAKSARKTTRPAKKASKRGGASRRPQDAVAVIKADHAAVNDLFKRYRAAGKTAPKTKRSIVDRVVRELSIHAAIEEQILYPAVRRGVPNGERLVKEAISEHQELKETLAELDKLPADDHRFDRLVRQAMDEVRHHVREEESSDGMLARLRKSVDHDELVTMAKALKAAKKVAPTRPHPNAPSTPPGNIVVGAAAAIVDKARDAVRGR